MQGELISIGTIEELARTAIGESRDDCAPLRSLTCLEIRFIATMTSENDPVGAWKLFEIADEGRTSRAATAGTYQMYKRREKRQVRRWLGEV